MSTFFWGCTGLHDSEAEKRKQQNAKEDWIYRKEGEIVYQVPPIQRREREKYPWEAKGEAKGEAKEKSEFGKKSEFEIRNSEVKKKKSRNSEAK